MGKHPAQVRLKKKPRLDRGVQSVNWKTDCTNNDAETYMHGTNTYQNTWLNRTLRIYSATCSPIYWISNDNLQYARRTLLGSHIQFFLPDLFNYLKNKITGKERGRQRFIHPLVHSPNDPNGSQTFIQPPMWLSWAQKFGLSSVASASTLAASWIRNWAGTGGVTGGGVVWHNTAPASEFDLKIQSMHKTSQK